MIWFSIGNDSFSNEAGRHWYDTKAGITKAIKTLAGLVNLISARQEAGYQRQERLNEFYILGRYWLDTCGNCAKAIGKAPKDVIPDMPDVLTNDEFWAYTQALFILKSFSLSFSLGDDSIPLPSLKCTVCGKQWDVQNCHDTVVWHKTEVFPLTEFVGKTLGEVKDFFKQKDDAIYRMQPDIIIRNEKNIDLSPKYAEPKDDWEKKQVKNEHGWLSERDGITDDYVIQAGDEGFFNIWTYYHQACNRKHLHQQEELRFKDIFEKAGFKDIRMASLPNEYCPCDHCAPWFNVNTEFGTIKIGWRKRVINIDWSLLEQTLKECGKLPKKNILSLFKKEDVTKEETLIHAWGWEKAEEYLTKIHDLLAA